MSEESIGEVNLFAARLGKRHLALMRHHTDDLHPLGFRRANPYQDSFANGGFFRESLGCQELIDDREVVILCIVRIRESSARDKRRAE